VSEETQVVIPSEVKATIETRVAWAQALVIRSQAERDGAIAIVKEVKGLITEVKARFEDNVASAFKAHREAVKVMDSFLTGPLEVERLAKAAIVRYDAEQEEIRRKEQARLQAIADEAARKERVKAEEAARAQREKEEAARKVQEEALRRAQEATNEADRIKAQAEAEKARKAAETAAAKAEAKDEQAAAVVAPVVSVASQAVKAKGESKATICKARVIDAQAFITAAVAAGRFEFIKVDESALNDFARRTAGKVKLTGVEFYEETQMRVRV
jgi:hypothetical protein